MESPRLGLAFASVFVFGLASVAGCEGSGAAGARATDGAITTDAAADAPDGSRSEAGKPFAVDDGVERVTLAHAILGGRHGCFADVRTVEYVRATRTMTWAACTAEDGGAGLPEAIRALSASEGAEVETALRAIDYEENPACFGYDGPEYFMVTTGSDGGTKQYSAFNVNCYGHPTAPLIEAAYKGIDALPK